MTPSEPVSTSHLPMSRVRGFIDSGFLLLLTVFFVGYFWAPPIDGFRLGLLQDLLFYFLVVPLFWLARAPRLVPLLSRPLFWLTAVLMAQGLLTLATGSALRELAAFEVLVHVVACFSFVAMIATLTRQEFWRIATAVVVAASAMALYSMALFALGRNVDGRLYSGLLEESPETLAYGLGTALLMVLSRVFASDEHQLQLNRSQAALCLVILTVAVVLTDTTRATFGLCAAGYLAWLLHQLVGQGRRLVPARVVPARVVIVTFVAAALLFLALKVPFGGVRDHSARAFVYEQLVERGMEHPFLGSGLAARDDVPIPAPWPGPFATTVWRPHSLLVGTFFYAGLMGLLLLAAVTIESVRTSRGLRLRLSVRDPERSVGDLAAPLLLFGVICSLGDLDRLANNPRSAIYLVFWLPVALLIGTGFLRSTPAPEEEVPKEEVVRSREDGARLDSYDLSPPAWAPSRSARAWLLALVVLLSLITLQRFFHLGPEIDSPHLWRQSDTAHYAWSFYDQGIDLLRPSVAWLGNYKTLILEFPLPEAIVALAYRVFGDQLVVARLVFLAFAMGSAGFLFLFLRRLIGGSHTAAIAVFFFLASPLSLFYSRAIHIDFSALFFVHAMAWCYLKAVDQESRRWLWLGSCCAALALLIKAPYALPFAVVLVGATARRGKLRFALRNVFAFIAPAVLFVVWQGYVFRTNAAVPVWEFIPDHKSFDSASSREWYFGTLRQRLNPGNWQLLLGRHLTEVGGVVTFALAAVGLLASVTGEAKSEVGSQSSRWLSWGSLWPLSLVAYLLIFFNLNLIHNYYQIPMVAVLSALAAVGVCTLAATVAPRWQVGLVVLLLVAAGAEQIVAAERNYYFVSEPQVVAGALVQESTPKNALVITSWGDYDSRSPHILVRARRFGWSIPQHDLSAEVVAELQRLGATYLVSVGRSASQLDSVLGDLDRSTVADIELTSGQPVSLIRLGAD